MIHSKTMHAALVHSLAAVLLMLVGTSVFAETLAYRSIGEFGEANFSDIHNATAQTIVLPQSSQPPLSSDELITQMLTVAEELERARLAREAQRAANRIEVPRTATQPEQDVVTLHDDRYPIFFPHQPHHPSPPHRPDPQPPTKTFRFEPNL
jgi:hypothetical protein